MRVLHVTSTCTHVYTRLKHGRCSSFTTRTLQWSRNVALGLSSGKYLADLRQTEDEEYDGERDEEGHATSTQSRDLVQQSRHHRLHVHHLITWLLLLFTSVTSSSAGRRDMCTRNTSVCVRLAMAVMTSHHGATAVWSGELWYYAF